MHEVHDAVVQGGSIVLTNLSFADGQRVRVTLSEGNAAAPPQRVPIEEVRRELKGGVERFDEPFEPMVPTDHWEMVK
jgi:hypothetical protein